MPPGTPPLLAAAERWYWPAGRLFARRPAKEAVATRTHFDSSPEAVWNRLMFYEEVPGRPPLLLRLFLPHPVRTEGDRAGIGGKVRCIYSAGDLVKRITAFDPPHLLQFEVVEQCLGIERFVRLTGGSWRVHRRRDGAELVLVTNYRALLRPRRLWRPLEKLLARQLHRHILHGVREALPARSPAAQPLPRDA